MYSEQFVSRTPTPTGISIHDAPILVDKDDYEGIQIAVRSLAEDFGRVTGSVSEICTLDEVSPGDGGGDGDTAILVGSIGSSLIQSITQQGKLDSSLAGKWETYSTSLIGDPLPGIKKSLVIAGSDKRGTIYGVYALSEQIGVSPYVP